MMNLTAHDLLSYSVAFAFVALAASVIYVLFRYNAKFCDILLEADGSKASLSRFQLLFFTIIIGGAYLERMLDQGKFDLDPTALALLGISSGSFLVSKGISASSTAQQAQQAQADDQDQQGSKNPPVPAPGDPSALTVTLRQQPVGKS
jgi:hypothetical protein